MADGTGIEWTDASWNPLRARAKREIVVEPVVGAGGVVSYHERAGSDRPGWSCKRVSPGCANCYAERLNRRLGTGLAYDAKGVEASEHYLDEDALGEPLSWKRGRRIFVSSMTDVFGEWVTDDQLDRIFAVMALTPQHTYQVLTKRPERMREYLTSEVEMRLPVPDSPAIMRPRKNRVWLEAQGLANVCRLPMPLSMDWTWPLPNVWLGVSVENDTYLIERWYELAATPSAKRFISYEPALGPLSTISSWLYGGADNRPMWTSRIKPNSTGYAIIPRIDWVIVGGESGPGARPFDISWARQAVDACQLAGVPVFVKQLGAKPYTSDRAGLAFPHYVDRFEASLNPYRVEFKLRSRKGGDPEEWPADLRVREFPE